MIRRQLIEEARIMKRTLLVCILAISAVATGSLAQQRGGGQRGAAPAAAPLPDKPTAVALPTISAEITAPGKMFDSSTSLPPGRDPAYYKYEVKEYFVTGTANNAPYSTRIVVRKPASNGRFSGLTMVEAMHPSGAAHMFEFTSESTMSSGHMAVEIVTSFTEPLAQNPERYKAMSVNNLQIPEILAQVGALVKSKKAGTPFANVTTRKMVLAGTSATAAILSSYLPGHMVYRTPDMQRIYDGFLPMSNGGNMQKVDVPMIHVPTLTEYVRNGGNVTTRPDGDAAGDQYRLYAFAGMAHVDSRDSVRFKPDPCRNPSSQFPVQAYMSVALNLLYDWVDKGKVPPRVPRIEVDGNTANDGSPMALDAHGNAKGGIRNPYVDVPAAKFGVQNEAANPPISNPSAWIAAHTTSTTNAAAQMCQLGGYQIALSKEELKKLYGTPKAYQDRVKKSLTDMEKAGWSLPVYRDMILADAAKVTF
jgi:hypothetical protein